jgi:hypothetical protein
MNKKIIAAAFGGVLASGFLAVSAPVAHADLSPWCSDPNSTAFNTPACAPVNGMPVPPPAAPLPAPAPVAAPLAPPPALPMPAAALPPAPVQAAPQAPPPPVQQAPGGGDSCSWMLNGPNPSPGAYQGCEVAKRATGG